MAGSGMLLDIVDDALNMLKSILQLLDELRVHTNHLEDVASHSKSFLEHPLRTATDISTFSKDASTLLSTFLSADNDKFEAHLASRASDIKLAVTEIFSKTPLAAPDVQQLQQKLNELLGAEKDHVTELQRLTAEKDKINDMLEDATFKAMVAQKKLERSKSAIYNKVMNPDGMKTAGPEVKRESSTEVNGASDGVLVDEETLAAKAAAEASAEKRKEQLTQLEEENRKLLDQVTALNTRLTSLSDDDYAKTDLFKALKSQHEDVISRINHLEATNVQLREEAQKLQAERTAHRLQVEEQSRTAVTEAETELAKAESDLARIRTSRDEYQAELNIRKETHDEAKSTLAQLKDLNSASESRISALEAEVERLKIRTGELKANESAMAEGMDPEQLRAKITSLEKEYALIGNELPAMESAWKKAQALAKRNVQEVSNWEEQVARLSAEKAKATEKYFGAMKSKEARDAEARTLRMQNAKSSGIVTQLKEAEGQAKAFITQMERQLAEARETQTGMMSQLRTLQQQVTNYTISSENLTTQTVELKKLLTVRDSELVEISRKRRDAEVELEDLNARLSEAKKSVDNWKKKAKGQVSEADEMLRVSTVSSCTVVRLRLTFIKEDRLLLSLQGQPQRHTHQDLQPRLLWRLHLAAYQGTHEEMPRLHEGIRHRRCF